MNTLGYIINKYKLNIEQRSPVEIPDVGRDCLAALFAELGFTVGVELGVEAGLYSEVLCCTNPNLKLYAVDAWRAYSGYREHVTQTKLDTIRQEAIERLAPYNCEIVRGFSMDVVKLFDRESLDFVYIDGNHSLRHVVQDIDEWSKLVRPGGIVSGHDFKRTKAPRMILHVVQAVRAYTECYRINPWFLLGTRTKKPGEIRDGSRSWMWVKR